MTFTYSDRIDFKDTAVSDAYRKLRVSSPFGIFNSTLQNSIDPHEWENIIVGSGDVNWLSESSSALLEVGTADGDRMLRQTLRTFQYQTGTSTLVYMTGVLGEGRENTKARIGIYDDLNGLFFEVRNNVFGVVLRKTLTAGNTVETFVPQSEFNGDKADGTGPSLYNIDLAATQIFSIDYAWLGVGRVRFSLWTGNCFCAVHTMSLHNIDEFPYMGKGDLPLRYEIINTGLAVGTYNLKQICSSVFVEGGLNKKSYARSITTPANTVYRAPGDNLWHGLLHLRIKNGFNRITVNILGFSVHSSSDNIFHIGIFKNATLPTLTWQDSTDFTEFAVHGNAISDGVLLYSTVLGGQRNSLAQLPADLIMDVISTKYDGSSETFTLAVRRVAGQSDTAAALNYSEIRG